MTVLLTDLKKALIFSILATETSLKAAKERVTSLIMFFPDSLRQISDCVGKRTHHPDVSKYYECGVNLSHFHSMTVYDSVLLILICIVACMICIGLLCFLNIQLFKIIAAKMKELSQIHGNGNDDWVLRAELVLPRWKIQLLRKVETKVGTKLPESEKEPEQPQVDSSSLNYVCNNNDGCELKELSEKFRLLQEEKNKEMFENSLKIEGLRDQITQLLRDNAELTIQLGYKEENILEELHLENISIEIKDEEIEERLEDDERDYDDEEEYQRQKSLSRPQFFSIDMFQKAIKVSGAVGTASHHINGIFIPTLELSCGLHVYSKQSNKDIWMVFRGHEWVIQQTSSKGTRSCWAYLENKTGTLPEKTSGVWTVAGVKQPSVVISLA